MTLATLPANGNVERRRHAFWRTWQVDVEVLRLLADAGDDDAQRQLAVSAYLQDEP